MGSLPLRTGLGGPRCTGIVGRMMGIAKKVLTTGDVARICNVAPRTVSKWFDTGQLRGYRIPGSKDRRIPLSQLVRFMKAHGMPLNHVRRGGKKVLVLDSDSEFAGLLSRKLAESGEFDVVTASSAFEAGAAAEELKPDVLVVDVTLPDVTPTAICRFLRANADLQDACLIGTACGLSEAQGSELIQAGFDSYLSKPFDVRQLIHLIDAKSNGHRN